MLSEEEKRFTALENQIKALITSQIITLRSLYRIVRSLDTENHPDCKKLASTGQALQRLISSIERSKY